MGDIEKYTKANPPLGISFTTVDSSKGLESLPTEELDRMLSVISAARNTVERIWSPHSERCSMFVLFLVNHVTGSEKTVCDQLLYWHHFLARETASLRCIPSSDSASQYLCRQLGVTQRPSLLISNSSNLDSYLCLNDQMISRLMRSDGDEQEENFMVTFINEVHAAFNNGCDYEELRKRISRKDLLAKAKISLQEFKSWVTFRVNTSI